MSPYAARTQVPVAKSRDEIERALTRAGATSFGFGWDESRRAVIQFELKGLRVQLVLVMPARTEWKSNAAGEAAWQQEQRRRWRALLLIVKAKLEAVESGISTLEQEFMAGIVLPDGRTFSQWAAPLLPDLGKKMPPMLPGLE